MFALDLDQPAAGWKKMPDMPDSRLGKPQKKSFFSCPTTKGGGVRARPLRKKKLFFNIFNIKALVVGPLKNNFFAASLRKDVKKFAF